jgi:hypothetical protein
MIILEQNSGNTIAVTATIDTTTTGGTWYLKLISETTNQIYSGITLTDYSTAAYRDRYNQFYITLTTKALENKTNAFIYLPQNGYYQYYIYNGTTEVERGLCLVQGEQQITTTEYTKPANQWVSYKKK